MIGRVRRGGASMTGRVRRGGASVIGRVRRQGFSPWLWDSPFFPSWGLNLPRECFELCWTRSENCSSNARLKSYSWGNRRSEKSRDSCGVTQVPKLPLGLSLCSLVTEMCPPASFLPGPAGSSHESLSPPLAPWGWQHLPSVLEASSKASWGFLRSFSVRPAGSHRQEGKRTKKGRTSPGNSQQKQS